MKAYPGRKKASIIAAPKEIISAGPALSQLMKISELGSETPLITRQLSKLQRTKESVNI